MTIPATGGIGIAYLYSWTVVVPWLGQGGRPERRGIPMWRTLTLATLLLLGSAAVTQAQFFPRPNPPGMGGSVEGTWFYQGDPTTPCSIQIFPGPTGAPRLILTNENGEQSRGRLLPGGRIVADDWGLLPGRITGNRIRWANGTVWTR
jgi:hypothetical protein